MNKIIKNTLILAAITVVSGLVLGAAYEVTKGPIAQTQAKQKQEACQAVYPEADSFEAMDVDQKAAKEAIKKMRSFTPDGPLQKAELWRLRGLEVSTCAAMRLMKRR